MISESLSKTVSIFLSLFHPFHFRPSRLESTASLVKDPQTLLIVIETNELQRSTATNARCTAGVRSHDVRNEFTHGAAPGLCLPIRIRHLPPLLIYWSIAPFAHAFQGLKNALKSYCSVRGHARLTANVWLSVVSV